MIFTMREPIKKKSLNETPPPIFSINQIKKNTISFDNNDMNSIKKKYEFSGLASPPAAIHNFKKGMLERVNIKTKECGSCGR